MLSLTPKLCEEIVFTKFDLQIKIKFYIAGGNHVRMAITAPQSVRVARQKIKNPVHTGSLYGGYIDNDSN